MEFPLTSNDLLAIIYFAAPAYAANSMPVIFTGTRSIDFRKKLPDGERILGSHKTIKGMTAGLLAGFLVSIALYLIFPVFPLSFGFLVTIGAILGDLIGAFIKRRLKIAPGGAAPLLDQLDFIIGAALLSYPVGGLPITLFIIIILITPPIHLITNICAYLLGLKKNYW